MLDKYAEQIALHERYVSRGRTITETDVVLFAAFGGDWYPLHTDREWAARSVFGERIAHGLLGLSVASGLAMQLGFMTGTVEAFREFTWKFRLPVLMGDTIHIVATATSKKAMPASGAPAAMCPCHALIPPAMLATVLNPAVSSTDAAARLRMPDWQ